MGPNHKRLMGAWKSDKRKTFETYRGYHKFSLSKKRRLGAIFGKIEFRYTPKFCETTFNGIVTKERYDVVAEDAAGIVIRTYSEEFKKTLDPSMLEILEDICAPKLAHLQFETVRRKEYYWIGLGGYCEWFKKIELPN